MFWSTTPLILHSCLPGRLHLPTKKHMRFQKVYFNREHDAWQLKNLVRYELYTLIIIDGHPILSWKYKECSSFFPVIFGDAQRLDHLNWKVGRCFTSAPRTPFSELAEGKKCYAPSVVDEQKLLFRVIKQLSDGCTGNMSHIYQSIASSYWSTYCFIELWPLGLTLVQTPHSDRKGVRVIVRNRCFNRHG